MCLAPWMSASGIQNINLSGVTGGAIAAGIYPLFTYPAGGFNGGANNFLVNFGAYAYSGNQHHHHHAS